MNKSFENCKGCIELGKQGEDNCLIGSRFGAATCLKTKAEVAFDPNGFGPTRVISTSERAKRIAELQRIADQK